MKKDAVRVLNQRRSEIDNRKICSSTASVGDLLDLYLADQTKQARRSVKQAEGYVRLHLRPAFGRIIASEIKSQSIDGFMEQKRSAGYSNASINRWLEALRRSFALGMTSMPQLVYIAPRIEMLNEDNVREGFLEHDQYLVLLRELPEHQRLILVIGYHLGMRRSEILNLRWDQIDWAENLVRLEKKQTKGKQARVAPLYGDLRAFIEIAYDVRAADCPFVISWKGQGIKDSKTAWIAARERAGVPNLLVHDLRRTAVRNMVRAGIPEKQAMRISGHKSRSIFDRYDITDERDIKLAGDKLERYLAEKGRLVTKEVTIEKGEKEARAGNPLAIQ